MPAAPVDVALINTHLEYHPGLFVDRNDELRLIEDRVREAQDKTFVAVPIVNFWGVRGVGKTWLLRHLHYLYSYDVGAAARLSGVLPTCALHYSFPDSMTRLAMPDLVRALALAVEQQMPSALAAEEQHYLRQADASGDPSLLVECLRGLLPHCMPIVLLDNAGTISIEDWKDLERGLIEPLASTGRVLVVTAGRRLIPRWHRFEVRRRALEPDKCQLRPFDRQAVGQQIARHAYHLPVDLLFRYAVGNPHLVFVLARHLRRWAGEPGELGPTWLEEHRDGLLQILRAVETQLLDHVPAALRPVLDALAPLRQYRLEALRVMLSHQEGEPVRYADGYYLGLLRRIEQGTDIVWWDRGKRAYMTSESVRQIISRRLLIEDSQRYVWQHTNALAMYREWVQALPENSAEYLIEIWFHLVSLYLVEQNLDRLRREIHATLDVVHRRLSTDQLLILQKLLESDRELLDLCPEVLGSELFSMIERLLVARAR